MATKKNYWYVLVLTDGGPTFVTKVEYAGKTAFWDKSEKPLELGMEQAKDLAFGLRCNFYSAYPVCCPVEQTSQPYRYDAGHFEWVWTNKKKEGAKK